MNDDKGMTCEGCGQRVRIYSSGEGTNSYEGVDAEDLGKTHAEVERLLALNASISDDLHDASVEISERDAEIARLKSELDSQRGFVRAVVNPDHALCVKERAERDAEIARLHADYAGVIREKDKIIEKQDATIAELRKEVERLNEHKSIRTFNEASEVWRERHRELQSALDAEKERAENLLRLIDNFVRFRTGDYVGWSKAGGPGECKHGYAAGLPCPDCTMAEARKLLAEREGRKA